jgi:carotenoid cleavage dioxygenase
MTQPFPSDDVFLKGWMAPSGLECDAPDLIVEGELPADLQGTYFRNGPDPLHPPRKGDRYHWFHGDGMIQRFHFGEGRVSWKNRWVRTRKYELERAAGESLFGVLGNPMTADPSVASEEYNTANTHIVWHHGKLLALMEGALAVEVDPGDLSTVQTIDFDGQISGPITAHPKFDPKTGEMVFFGYQALGPGSREIRYNVADRNGKLIRNEMLQAPFASMVHDFFVTDTHVVFPIFPLTFDIQRAIERGMPLAWEPDKGTHFGVMPRDGTAADVVWYEMEPRFMFHMMNAWNEGSTLQVDVTAANATQFAPMPDGNMASESDGIKPLFRRWSFDLDGGSNSVAETMLDDLPCEFPRTDDRFSTQPYRHGFAVGGRGRELMFNQLVHYDTAAGTSKTWSGGEHYLFGEAVVAPRAGAADEADGYMLMLAFNQQTQLSELMVFEALDIEQGPVAKAMLPIRIPAGFHGSWVGA